MKKILTLGAVILGCCLVAWGQAGSYSNQAPPSISGYSQDQAGQPKSYPGSSADQPYSDMNSASQKTTVQGCLTQSVDGKFVLADISGNVYQLNANAARLGQFVGQEIRVDGLGIVNSEVNPGAMASPGPFAGRQGAAQQIDVSRVRKVADTCKSGLSK